MTQAAAPWRLAVDRGPDWLFIRVEGLPDPAESSPSLSEAIWNVLDTHFVYRAVLEFAEPALLPAALLKQLAQLKQRVLDRGGLLRLCGSNGCCPASIRGADWEALEPLYADRHEAVLCSMAPRKPR